MSMQTGVCRHLTVPLAGLGHLAGSPSRHGDRGLWLEGMEEPLFLLLGTQGHRVKGMFFLLPLGNQPLKDIRGRAIRH